MTVSTLPLLPVLAKDPQSLVLAAENQGVLVETLGCNGNQSNERRSPVLGRVSESLWSPRQSVVQYNQIGIINSILLKLAASAVLLCLDWGAYW